jgi:ribulose-5-phosphate 4-epimerase/fuculose-1-phosphate aldolase
MQFQISHINRDECSTGEWEARVDLAAAHRLAVKHGLNEGIFNHLTQVVPGKPDRYYQIPFGMHWSEVKASSFMEVGINDGEVKRGTGDVERSCYCIHAPIHKALPQAKVVFHTHMPFASALTRLEDPRIKEIGQTEAGPRRRSAALVSTTDQRRRNGTFAPSNAFSIVRKPITPRRLILRISRNPAILEAPN